MHFIAKLAIAFFVHSLAFFGANEYIEGFNITGGIENLLIAAGILTGVNIFIKPIVRFLFTPLIIISLGLFTFVINGAILKLLDFLLPSIMINGLIPLLYATALFTLANIITHALFRLMLKHK